MLRYETHSQQFLRGPGRLAAPPQSRSCPAAVAPAVPGAAVIWFGVTSPAGPVGGPVVQHTELSLLRVPSAKAWSGPRRATAPLGETLTPGKREKVRWGNISQHRCENGVS